MIQSDFREDIQFGEENYDDIICNLEKIYHPEVMLDLILTNSTKPIKEDQDELA